MINLLRQHVERYTPEMVSNITGVTEKAFQTVCEALAETSAPNKTATFLML